ncbi:hypothetical protein DDE82_005536 [Stemphylium lycopersici]|nr:hypothetical protein DDE82_005536 [Stemphylium lycopersici]
MDLEKELVEIDRVGVGLERPHITNEGQIQLPERRPESSDSDTATAQDPANHVPTDAQTTTHRVFNKVKVKKHIAGIKIRKTFHMERPVDEDEESGTRSLVLVDTAEVKQSKSRLDDKSTASEKRSVKDIFNYPIDTLKHKGWCQGNQEVAAKVAVSEVPHGQEVDLVSASAAVAQAETREEKQRAEKCVSEMLRRRQSTYVRWSLDRHVTKIRVLPQDAIEARPRSDFERKDKHRDTFTDWRAYGAHLADFYAHKYGRHYIGYGSEPPVPCKETIMPSVERLIVAACPFQEFIMTTRRIYRWERPSETGKFLFVYMVLWHLNLLLPGVLSAILYLVAARRWHTQTIDGLREEIRQREDINETAFSLTDFIEKQGDDNWAHDLL